MRPSEADTRANSQNELSALSNPEAYTWRPLGILAIYRMVIVGCVALAFLGTRGTPFMQTAQPQLFMAVALTYLALAVIVYLLVRLRRPGFRWQVYGQLSLDIAAIAALILASGTIGNGLGALMLVAIAGGSILLTVRMATLFAALATLLLLGLQGLVHIKTGTPGLGYSQAGFLGMSTFLIAILGSLLARRARQNQALADRIGVDLHSLEVLNGHIVQRLQSGVVAVGPDGRVRLMNAAAWELTGRPLQTRDVPLSEISGTLEQVLRAWRADEQTEAQTLQLEGREVSLRLHPLGPGGNQGSLLFLEDTAALRAQVQQEKLAALGRLSASIAHELRNPLGAVMHASQLLGETKGLSEEDLKLIDIIRRHGVRMNTVVENVLQLSRQQEPSRTNIALRPWLDSFVDDIRSGIGNRCAQIEMSVEPENLQALFDPDHLQQVLDNLVRNALQHGGRDDLHIRLRARMEYGRILLDIEDNGRGIAQEHVARLFEPFFTTATSGTGLGLFLCRELCDSNRARLELRPSETGTRFRITFSEPVSEAQLA